MLEPTIVHAELPLGVLGYTDGETTIWIDQQLSQVDRRVVLEHELVHYVRGHRGHCLAVHEHGIDRIVASGLIHLDDLGDAAAWSPHPWVIAQELDVMPETVEDRLHTLTAGERAALAARLEDAYWAS
ncbi:ImmA/IrrE family metallo-endopeptidase [Brachybacterium squillarum]|uniref:ImmA/IrrE family metallo-endopeptidase n=1 Tax=Brachybacterium squillarum TaxID=661979 RepID=UPI002222EC19|nr:ImmA/IrrE family metallo-endopeptidase [Brachybacterium squillarum]MCW1805270.1 ImmA/IrrE family metallo-endopeptidase [Brachybacterium squillarum]